MRIVAAVVAVAVLAGAARAEDLPDQRPMLRIEPGMHTAMIRRIGVDAACTLMVTGSDDKTARLWALPGGEQKSPALLRTLRVPIGEGYSGHVNAVASSPDGKWVAAGGAGPEGENSVYIFEAATGRLVTRLGRLEYSFYHLAVSSDGSHLAVVINGGEGMRLWETGSWRLLAEDRDYDGKDSYGAAFDANALYTVAFDGAIRRYGAGGALEAKVKTRGGKEPYSIAVHPDGTKLAVGFNDTTAVEVYDSRTLKQLYAANTRGISRNVSSVAWSGDGERLFAGGNYDHAGGHRLIIWQDAGRGRRSEAPLSQNTIFHLLPCSDGAAATASDPAFGLVSADGAKRVWQEGVTADFRSGSNRALAVSRDGKRIRFGLRQDGREPVLFELGAFRLSDAAEAIADLAQAKISGLAVSDWEDSDIPQLNGKRVGLISNEISRALAIAPDSSRFTLGADWTLRAHDANGVKL